MEELGPLSLLFIVHKYKKTITLDTQALDLGFINDQLEQRYPVMNLPVCFP
jgi:hypothetical protein